MNAKHKAELQAARRMHKHFKKLLEDLYDVRYTPQGGCCCCYQSLYDYEAAAGIEDTP